MKRTFLACLIFASVSASAQVDATWVFQYFTGYSNAVRRVEIQPVAWGRAGNAIITPDRIKYTNDGSGSLTVSNMATNFAYRVDFYGPFATLSFTNYFPPGTTGAVYAADYLTATNLSGSLVGYTVSQANSRFALRSNAVFVGAMPTLNGTNFNTLFAGGGGGSGTVGLVSSNDSSIIVIPEVISAGITNFKAGVNTNVIATTTAVLSTNNTISRYINVLDYGVIADGVTTNLTTLQNALNAGSASNLPVRIPAGLYVVGTVTWPTTNVHVFGDGPDKTVLMPRGGSGGNAFNLQNTTKAILRDFCWRPEMKGGTYNSFATNATPPVTSPGILFNADGPGRIDNVWIFGGTYGLQITGTDSITTRPQLATFNNILITNCTIGVVTEGPNKSEYVRLNVNVANCWLGWSNAAGANIKWEGGQIRDCPGFAYWQKGTTNATYGYRGHSIIESAQWGHCGPVILENANNVTFNGGKIDCGAQVMGQTVSGTMVLDACTNVIFNNTWIGELTGTGTFLRFTNGGSFNQFNNIRIPIGGGTNIIGATAANSSGWNVRSDEFGTLLQPASTWTGVTPSGVFVGNGGSLTNLTTNSSPLLAASIQASVNGATNALTIGQLPSGVAKLDGSLLITNSTGLSMQGATVGRFIDGSNTNVLVGGSVSVSQNGGVVTGASIDASQLSGTVGDLVLTNAPHTNLTTRDLNLAGTAKFNNTVLLLTNGTTINTGIGSNYIRSPFANYFGFSTVSSSTSSGSIFGAFGNIFEVARGDRSGAWQWTSSGSGVATTLAAGGPYASSYSLHAASVTSSNTITATNGVISPYGYASAGGDIVRSVAATTTYYAVSNLAGISSSFNFGVSTNLGQITNLVAGTYGVTISASFNGQNNQAIECALFTNGVECAAIEFQRTLGASAAVGSAAATGVLTLPANCVSDIRIQSTSGTGNVTFSKLGFRMGLP